VRLGIADDQFSELQEGDVQAGQEVVIGLNDKDSRASGGGRPGATSRTPPARF
jgi:hypothetical protein